MNPRRQERLESLEMREAIYESHGIMTSADKKHKQSSLFKNIQHRKAHSFAYDSSEVVKKLTFRDKSGESESERQ